MDYAALKTPSHCIVDFSVIPIGTTSPTFSHEIAAVLRLLKGSGLVYEVHSSGTTIEGPWDDVMNAIGKAHVVLHNSGVTRLQTDIRAGSRTDKEEHFPEMVEKVRDLLAVDDK